MRIVITLLTSILLTGGAAAQNADWKTTWNELVAGAKKEGRVIVAGSPDPVMRAEIIPRFTKEFGVNIEFIAGSSGQLAGRVRTERLSGVYSVDVYLPGAGTALTVMHPEKMIDPLKPLLILPEVVEGKYWKSGKPTFADNDGAYVMMLFRSVDALLFINADHVKPGDLRSIHDILNPKWKGKIASQDPAASGTGANTAVQFYTQFGPDFIRKLYIDQKPTYSRDRRQLTDWLARGTHPICLTCRPDDARALQKEGYKLEEVYQLDGIKNRVTATPFLMAIANRPPNPNAAKVFVNWLASKAQLETYSRSYGATTLRNDVDESFLDPRTIPKPGVEYIDDTNGPWLAKGRKEAAEKLRAVLRAR